MNFVDNKRVSIEVGKLIKGKNESFCWKEGVLWGATEVTWSKVFTRFLQGKSLCCRKQHSGWLCLQHSDWLYLTTVLTLISLAFPSFYPVRSHGGHNGGFQGPLSHLFTWSGFL
jgi:hypothetical protein